jgi:competence ComEA-like helix-hairpin-helix protein
MNWNRFVKDYFSFTRKERIGLSLLVIAVIGIWIFPKIAASGKTKVALGDTSWMIAAKELQHNQENSETTLKSTDESVNDLVYDKSTDNSHESKSELFYFDPNTLSFDGWKKLGVREKTIITIQKYLNKGGHFYVSEDLKKIYGIRTNEYERLKPYIQIETTNRKHTSEADLSKETRKKQSNSKPKLIEINAADTSAFIALTGIGSKLATRIVNFRDKLGGFYSVDQLAETYGLHDSTFQKIKAYLSVDNSFLKKININVATKDEMKSHPYIKWNLANAIVEYRNQHGNYASIDDLKKISMVTEEMLAKLKPYLLAE